MADLVRISIENRIVGLKKINKGYVTLPIEVLHMRSQNKPMRPLRAGPIFGASAKRYIANNFGAIAQGFCGSYAKCTIPSDQLIPFVDWIRRDSTSIASVVDWNPRNIARRYLTEPCWGDNPRIMTEEIFESCGFEKRPDIVISEPSSHANQTFSIHWTLLVTDAALGYLKESPVVRIYK